MRHLSLITLLGIAALSAGCGREPQGPVVETNPADTAQSRGTLLLHGESMFYDDELVWIPGTELVAFRSAPPTGGCAIKTLDAGDGRVRVLDEDCGYTSVPYEEYLADPVAAPDGSRLYYTVGLGESVAPEWVLRVVDLSTGATTNLDSGVAAELAVSPDGRLVAYVADGSLRVLDLAAGVTTAYARQGSAGPITFSPDGTELLYGGSQPALGDMRLGRLSLGDATDRPLVLPDALRRVELVHWDTSGIEALVVALSEDAYRVVNLTTGASVGVGSLQNGATGISAGWIWGTEAWSLDGTRVAYWVSRCFELSQSLDCILARYALYVADTRTGSRVRVANTSAGYGPIALSPDGTRVLYHASGGQDSGDFYLVDVPVASGAGRAGGGGTR